MKALYLDLLSIKPLFLSIYLQAPIEPEGTSSVEGFYVGYKIRSGSEPFTFKSVPLTEDILQHFHLQNLNRFTEYIIIVQPFNSRGAGPPSEEVEVRTLEFGTIFI